MAKVLIVDDEQAMCKLLSSVVEGLGHEAVCVGSLREALHEVLQRDYDLVFLDVFLPDGNGLEQISKFQEVGSRPEILIITGAGSPQGAQMAIKSGAWDYVQKPASLSDLELSLLRALQYREMKRRGSGLKALKVEGVIGQCSSMLRCLEQAAQAALSDVTVLITGETGTGKELMARAIHQNSPRAEAQFLVVDCAAIPGSLVESMLFGYVRGAFTGADKEQKGLIGEAHRGTLFLDEVGELDISTQKAFLRVLQEKRYRPVGSREELESDFRLIAATNRDLEAMVKEGRFREDLLHRLRALNIHLPPLRERREDIQALIMYYTTRICKRQGWEIKGFAPETLHVLSKYHWPGNIRELVNTLESMIIAAHPEPVLFPVHLPNHIRIHFLKEGFTVEEVPVLESASFWKWPEPLPTIKEARELSEKNYLQELVRRCGKDIQKACKMSGLSRSQLYELMKRHVISTRGEP